MGRPPINPSGPMTARERAAKSHKNRAAAGGRTVHLMLEPEAAAALDRILATARADTATEAISRALIRWAKRIKPPV